MIEIRRFRVDDAPAVAALERVLFSVPYDVPWSQRTVAAYAGTDHRLGWIADDSGTVRGYLLASMVLDEANIDAIGVDPSVQRQGIARRLLNCALAHFTECGVREVWLEVAVRNAAAHAFYLNAGFTEVARRRNYYRGPTETCDAVVMRLILTP